VYRFVVLFAVACICLVLAGSAGAQTFSCPAGTEDMLNYFVMNYPDRADYHMGPGNANPIYSAIFPDNGLSFATTGYLLDILSGPKARMDIRGMSRHSIRISCMTAVRNSRGPIRRRLSDSMWIFQCHRVALPRERRVR